MKVLHIAMFDRKGGACIAAYRQHQALRRIGVESMMWVRQKFTDDPNVFEFKPQNVLPKRFYRILRRHLISRNLRRSSPTGELFDDRSEHGGMELEGMPKCDVINVQFSQNFLNISTFYNRVTSETPIVVSLHEMSMFTGGCSYAYECRRFENTCGCCPQLANHHTNDFTATSWKRKHNAYRSRDLGSLHFVADSNWLGNEARSSSLLRGLPIHVIHYGIDVDIFSPNDKFSARQLLGLPTNRTVIAFAASTVSDTRKGISYLIQAIAKLPFSPFLLTWGSAFIENMGDIPHRHLGPINSEHLMSVAYAACDFFVIPSVEEAFGQTCLEAMSCGRPVIGFQAGGIPDMISNNDSGFLIPKRDTAALAKAMADLSENRAKCERFGANSRRIVNERFSFAVNARNYQQLYESIIQT